MFELLDKRSAYTKTFDVGAGLRQLVTSGAPQNVPSDVPAWKQGRPTTWETIDRSLVRQDDESLALRRAWFGLTVPARGVGYRYTSKITGGSVEVRLLGLGQHARPHTAGEDIWWDHVGPDLDMYLRVMPGAIEVYKRLSSQAAPRAFVWEIAEQLPSTVALVTQTAGYDNIDETEPSRVGVGVGRHRRALQMMHAIGPDDLRSRPGWRVFTLRETWTGKTIGIGPNPERVPYLSDEVAWPVEIDANLTEGIQADADDGNQRLGDKYWFNNLGAGTDVIYGGLWYPGYRFTGITITQGATVSAATLTLTIKRSGGSAGAGAVLYGNAVDNAPAWVNYHGPIEMTHTTATATFPAWGGSASGVKVIDVTAICQELLNRSGWVSGNAMAFGVQGTLTGGYSYFYDLNGGASNIASLSITYSTGGGGPSQVPYQPAYAWSPVMAQ
jgi:hypothetical protein